jgi:predicted RNA-binding Zn ribbon-like protein
MPGVRIHGDNAALVERVRSFVNHLDPGPAPVTGERPHEHDLALARELQAVLRDQLRHRHPHDPGAERPDAERRRFERLAAQLPLRVALAADGRPSLVPAVSGARYGLAQVLAAVVALPADDWDRLKVCPADDCQSVFYDASRNRSRRWCSMEGCGNRSKVRSFRQRAR